MKIEVLGTERRRRWSFQDKLQIVEETLQPAVTVTEVARRHGLAPSVVFTWRRLARQGRLGDAGPAFVPVEITPIPVQAPPAASPLRRAGLIEIVLRRGRRIRVDREVDAEALRRVLQVLASMNVADRSELPTTTACPEPLSAFTRT
jgi:transposase